MSEQTHVIARAFGEQTPDAPGAGKARAPAYAAYDNGEIMLELLRARSAEEGRRRFVEGLRRLRGHDSPDDPLTATS